MNILDAIVPFLPDLGLGGLLGYCAGYAIKKASRLLILIVGVAFVLVQLLAYFGLLTVHWTRVEELAGPLVQEGAREGGAWALAVLGANLPFGGAFVAGLALGLRAK